MTVSAFISTTVTVEPRHTKGKTADTLVRPILWCRIIPMCNYIPKPPRYYYIIRQGPSQVKWDWKETFSPHLVDVTDTIEGFRFIQLIHVHICQVHYWPFLLRITWGGNSRFWFVWIYTSFCITNLPISSSTINANLLLKYWSICWTMHIVDKYI